MRKNFSLARLPKWPWLGLLLLLPVLAQTKLPTFFSPPTVKEVGSFLATITTDDYNRDAVEAKQLMEFMEAFVLDVRPPQDYKNGHVPGAVNIPLHELPNRLAELPKGKPIVVYCGSSHRAAMALLFLRGQGYEVYNIRMGWKGWTGAGLPVEK
ncbi:rhodanese-like domain-containing protein [Thermus altitudinis]|uniref:rhodanese-like domain-containing protein n=1 Tax=Thermus altitudinis TaxID=2908145 RepID=UPI001FAA9DF5|nr:rhodanese-like domain-containing protein [Thermus altitudinis]